MPAAFELTPTGCAPGATVDCGAAQRRILLPGVLEQLPWSEARAALDRAYIEEALEKRAGDPRGAARDLGVHERTVYKLRRRFGLGRRRRRR